MSTSLEYMRGEATLHVKEKKDRRLFAERLNKAENSPVE